MNATLVLNSAYQPLGSISVTDAVILVATGKAFAIKSDPEKLFRSQYLEVPSPVIVVLNHFQHMKSFKIRPAQLTNSALFQRDNYRCQYCGRYKDELGPKNKLTRDHIIPKDSGGKNTWENVTTACAKCNHKKDNRTLQAAKMKLLSTPTVPITWSLRGKSKLTQEQLDYVERLLKLENKL